MIFNSCSGLLIISAALGCPFFGTPTINNYSLVPPSQLKKYVPFEPKVYFCFPIFFRYPFLQYLDSLTRRLSSVISITWSLSIKYFMSAKLNFGSFTSLFLRDLKTSCQTTGAFRLRWCMTNAYHKTALQKNLSDTKNGYTHRFELNVDNLGITWDKTYHLTIFYALKQVSMIKFLTCCLFVGIDSLWEQLSHGIYIHPTKLAAYPRAGGDPEIL